MAIQYLVIPDLIRNLYKLNTTIVIDFIHVSKSYPNNNVVLDDIDFSVSPGDFLIITGKSGAGKTTIGRLLIHDLVPNKGRIIVDGEDLTKIKSQNIPMLRRKIGFGFQDFRMIPDKTIGENIVIVLEISGYDPLKIPEKIKHILDLVGLSGKENLFPGQLSGGEIQRASIARAIAADPPILFTDEPTGNLDKDTSLEIFDLLRKINSAGTTVIMATHDVTLINLKVGRHIHLQKGKIVKEENYSTEDKKETKE